MNVICHVDCILVSVVEELYCISDFFNCEFVLFLLACVASWFALKMALKITLAISNVSS